MRILADGNWILSMRYRYQNESNLKKERGRLLTYRGWKPGGVDNPQTKAILIFTETILLLGNYLAKLFQKKPPLFKKWFLKRYNLFID